MMNWSWYWHTKRRHTPKALCSQFIEINSFDLFKNQQTLGLIKASHNRISLQIPQFDLTAKIMDDDSLSVSYNAGFYVIPVEKKSCNYGGFYRFFHCPQCDKRMRKLYCVEGKFLCRKCACLGYYSQRLRPSERAFNMAIKCQEKLQTRGGSLTKRPPHMKTYTFHQLRKKYVDYDEARINAIDNDLRTWFGPKAEAYIEDFYMVPQGMYDVYDYGK